MSLYYLCAPIAAPTLAEQLRNCDRAAVVARYLRQQGHEVVCVHEGARAELEAAGGETPAMREAAMARCLELVRAVVAAGGCVAVLLRDDCTCSAGVAIEREQARQTWEAMGPGSCRARAGWEYNRMTWDGWQSGRR